MPIAVTLDALLLERGLTLTELAERIDLDHIAAHLYTKVQPDP